MYLIGRLVLVCVVTLSLQACGSSGPQFSESRVARPADNRTARLVFFRESHFVGGGNVYRVAVNGKRVGSMPDGSVLIVDVPPGSLNIVFSTIWSATALFNDGSLHMPVIAAAVGQEYYIEVKPGESTIAVGAVPMQVGHIDPTIPNQSCANGICGVFTDKAAALPRMRGLGMETPEGQ